MSTLGKTLGEISAEGSKCFEKSKVFGIDLMDLKADPVLKWYGKKGDSESLKISDLKVDFKYQRNQSPSKLASYGKFCPGKLQALLVAVRPDGSRWVIDGQGRCILYLNAKDSSGQLISETLEVPVPVYEVLHNKNASTYKCQEIEARLFKSVNTDLKKLGKIEILRSAIIAGEDSAIWFEDAMKYLNIVCDNVGSMDENAYKLKNANQFWLELEYQYSNRKDMVFDEYGSLEKALILYGDIYRKTEIEKNGVSGTILRGLVLIIDFVNDVLKPGQETRFMDWLRSGHAFEALPVKIVQREVGANGNSARGMLHLFLDRYSIYTTPRMVEIGTRNSIPVFDGTKSTTWRDAITKFGYRYLPPGTVLS